jgi:phosphate transport system substrate-binding protein
MKKAFVAGGVVLAIGASIAFAQTKIVACGATFPAAIYQKWFSDYGATHKGVQIDYTPNSSGGGVMGVTNATVDFGASDMPMTDQEQAAVKGKILHFPTVLGAVVPIYNISGVSQELKFSGPVLAGIFLGKITKWNDKMIVADNPGVKLPGDDIMVVHRSESSGTSFIFTDFLSKVSPDWQKKVGAAKAVNWPTGLGGNGSAGVAGLVKQTPNSISYVELIYAVQNKIGYGQVKNASGNWVKASMDTVSQAAAGVTMPDDFRVSITNSPGKTAYPIASFTWLLIPANMPDANKAKAVQGFLGWMLTDGQKVAPTLDFAPLPKPVVEKEEKQLATLSGAPAAPAKNASGKKK